MPESQLHRPSAVGLYGTLQWLVAAVEAGHDCGPALAAAKDQLASLAPPKLQQKARDLYTDSSCDIEVDSDAVTSRGSDLGTWVSGWLWVPDEDEDTSENCNRCNDSIANGEGYYYPPPTPSHPHQQEPIRMNELIEYVVAQRRGVIALPRNLGVFVGDRSALASLPAGWGFVDANNPEECTVANLRLVIEAVTTSKKQTPHS